MVVVCPVCREVVHLLSGYIAYHGARLHGSIQPCAASGTSYCYSSECCGGIVARE
ncbi:MAG: hypothetical protein [Microvirus sp.]|nr:MAG: hypothetical protein [Microvirus sp.]